jgi:diguanylate cyclase (GGDEF)-like protein
MKQTELAKELQSGRDPGSQISSTPTEVTEGGTDSFPVLVAEDNPVSRRLLEKSLKKAGIEVVTAHNGREAFEVFSKTFFPMVLTDWMMPEMNGLELCRAIRHHDSPGYVFIVFLTSKDAKDDIIAGLEAGADDYLTKPFHHAELMARLKTGKRILGLERSLKKANEDIRLLSITDPLTESFNRGYLMNRLPEEISRAKRYKRPLSIVMCDIDRFKSINDSCGHLAGDSVLRGFVDCLNGVVRQGIDWISRYGGEEFVVVLSETDHEGALVVAERLRESVDKQSYPMEEDQVINITASFGVASLNPLMDGDISSEDLMREADKCLYRAKKEGRNRVAGGC